MKLIRLIYGSIAAPGMSYAELMTLLRTAEEHNASRAISGMLCYGNGAFLQALEGDRDVVNRLYNRIVGDDRHSGCTLLSYGRIVSRSFEDWSMKLVSLDEQLSPHRRSLILRHSGTADFSPLQMSGAQASALLVDLGRDTRRVA
jgi:hypothetical protein